MTFRTRMTLSIAVVTALTLGGAFSAVTAAYNRSQLRELDTALLEVAREEAREAPEQGFAFSDRPGQPAADVGPLTKYGIIYDALGDPVSVTTPFDKAPPKLATLRHPDGEAFDFYFEKNRMRGVFVGVPRHPGNLVFLAASCDDLDADERYLVRAMIVACVVAVACASLIVYGIGARLTRDHAEIERVAHAVARGDLTARVKTRSPDSDIAQLGHDIDEMVDRLDELVGTQRRFIANAAHELRSPLTALYGELQLATRKERDAGGYKRAILQALEATRRLKALADDLLALARVQRDQSAQIETVRAEAVIDEACALLRDEARDHEVTLDIVADAISLPGVRSDLVRLIRNLVENAIWHSPPGGHVLVEARVDERNAMISVTDEGAGVKPEERERIFEPFFRAKRESGTRDGTGLGLGIAREIARAHGGTVTLAEPSAPKAGACFVIELPLAANARSPSLANATTATS